MKQKKHYQVWTEIQQWTEGKYNSQPTKTNVKTIKAKSKGNAIVKYIETLKPGQSGSIKAERIRDHKAGVSLKLYDQSGKKVFEVTKQLQDNPTLPKMEAGATQPTKSNFDQPTGVFIPGEISIATAFKDEFIKANPAMMSKEVKDAIDKIVKDGQKFNWDLSGPSGKSGRDGIDGISHDKFTTVDEYREKYGEDVKKATSKLKILLQPKEAENLDVHIQLTRKEIKTIFERWIYECDKNDVKFRIDPKEYHYNGPERMTQLFIGYAADILNWPDELTNAVNKQK